METLRTRYDARLRDFPKPGAGRHQALLAIANLGTMAEIPADQIHSDIVSAANPHRIPDAEINKAIQKALDDHRGGGSYRIPSKPKPIVKDGAAALQRIIDAGTIDNDADLWEASPIRLYHPPEQDGALFLEAMFKPDDRLFIGGQYDDGTIGVSIRRTTEWVSFFNSGGTAGPFIIINPFTGKPAPKKDGTGDSYRGDAAVAAYPHCLVEFDNITIDDQIRFWSGARLPVKALVHTGGKSIHAWLDTSKAGVPVADQEGWNRQIKTELYEQVLIPIGVDRACCNPSRLSRMPGWFRAEKSRYQRLLWLSPEGREVRP